MQYALIGYMVSFLVLFSNFYIHAYFVKKYRKHEKSEANGKLMANGDVMAKGEVMTNGEVMANGEVVANGIAGSGLKDTKKQN